MRQPSQIYLSRRRAMHEVIRRQVLPFERVNGSPQFLLSSNVIGPEATLPALNYGCGKPKIML